MIQAWPFRGRTTNEYDVYGEVTGSTGFPLNATTPYDFAGEQTDALGLQYLRARYMDPGTGTFISREPLASAPGWLGNPTAYAAGNPANLVDPTGLCGWRDPGGCVGGAVNAGIEVVDKVVLDTIALRYYGEYYISYHALGGIDWVSEQVSSATGIPEPLVDVLLAPISGPFVYRQARGLGWDIAIDYVKLAIGTGVGPDDEGRPASICVDIIEEWTPIDCLVPDLPGVHDGCGNLLLGEYCRIDIRGPFD